MDTITRRDIRDPDRAAVQEQVIAAVQADPDSFMDAYKRMPDTFGGRYVCSDSFKETFPQYAASPDSRDRYNTPVHNAAAVLASEQYGRALRDDSDPARDTVLFVTGIPGAGKTSSVVKSNFPPDCRVLFEGQLNRPETSYPKIDQALKAGLKVDIVAVHLPPELALERTLQRYEHRGRGASLTAMADIQGGLPAGLRQLHQRYGDALSLTIIDNLPGQLRKLDGWEHIPHLEKEGNRDRIAQRLEIELEARRAQGRVSEGGYRHARGIAPPPIERHGPMGQGRDAGLAGNVDGRGLAPTSGGEAGMTVETTRTVTMNGSSIDMVRDGAGWHNIAVRPAERPARAVAFEQLAEEAALKRHPELKGAYGELGQKAEALRTQNLSPDAAAKQLAGARADLQQRLDVGRIPAPPPISRGPASGFNRDR